MNRALDLLLDFLRSHVHSVAFPELAAPTALSLRRFAKETRVAAWRARAKALVDAVASQATRVAQRRAALGAAPSDRAAVAGFMAAERQAARDARDRERAAAAAVVAPAAASAPEGDAGREREGEEEAGEEEDEGEEEEAAEARPKRKKKARRSKAGAGAGAVAAGDADAVLAAAAPDEVAEIGPDDV